jgi:glycosyltransferase involved in cell wall biosynthesis
MHHVIGLGVPVWTYSEFNRRTLIDWGAGETQVEWVTFPIPSTSTRPSARDDDRVRLLVVGRLVPAKGVHVVVQALSMLPDSVIHRLRLRVVGSTRFSSAEYRAALDDQLRDSRQVLRDAVELVIGPSDDELGQIYRDTDVVISPSFHEGLCVPVIEGYAAGCRAIGTSAGNLPFIVVPPDPVVPPGDPTALAAAIETMIDHLDEIDEVYDARRRALVDSFSARSSAELLTAALRRTVGVA